jgi:hypothetical protein
VDGGSFETGVLDGPCARPNEETVVVGGREEKVKMEEEDDGRMRNWERDYGQREDDWEE